MKRPEASVRRFILIPPESYLSSMRRSSALVALLLVFVAIGAAGCTTVQPWERATLSSYSMRPDRDPLAQAMAEHIYFSRESAAGGRSVGGSGCGCN
jgi:Domain of unknown function (DUF4266)